MDLKKILTMAGLTTLAGVAAVVMGCSDGRVKVPEQKYDIHTICKKETESTTYFHDGREETTYAETNSDATVDGRLVRLEDWIDEDTAYVCVWTPISPYTEPEVEPSCGWEEDGGCWECGFYDTNQPIGETESDMFVRNITSETECETQEILGPHGEYAVVTENETCADLYVNQRSGCIQDCED